MIVRLIKWGAVFSLIALLALSMYFIYLYREIRNVAMHDEARPSDAIVVMGAAQYNGRPSPVLKARLDHALNLYNDRLARAIITTGSYGPDPNFSEAEVGRKYLVQHGVPVEQIITEQGSGTTYDSVRAVSNLLKSKNWKSALVVSDGFHLFRAKKMFADSGVVAYTSPAPNSPIEIDATPRFWHTVREVVLFSAYRWMNL